MNRHRFIAARAALVAGLLAVGLVAPAGAHHDVYVEVTAITIDRVAYVNGRRAGTIHVTGTLTCAATGHAQYTDVEATQRNAYGLTNYDLLDFECTTEPRRLRAVVEVLGGCSGFDCFKPGAARVRAISPTLTVEQMVIVKTIR